MTETAVVVAQKQLPTLVESHGEKAQKRFEEFFGVPIRNKHTRQAYFRALRYFFSWCEERRLKLETIEPIHVAAYIEMLTNHPDYGAPTVKQHLAAIRRLFDWFVTGQIMPHNPAAAVKGPSHSARKGKNSCALSG